MGISTKKNEILQSATHQVSFWEKKWKKRDVFTNIVNVRKIIKKFHEKKSTVIYFDDFRQILQKIPKWQISTKSSVSVKKRESGIFYNFLLIIAHFLMHILIEILIAFPNNSYSKFSAEMIVKVVGKVWVF